ncbi:uncharacterized protein LOC134241337 [Saccostrea cucullata]|uniref:uncharacterized protein LOC134241337 n=1 Tax=Saccostrea cuccullata TaxID=36930 RepID=UPI002ED456B6
MIQAYIHQLRLKGSAVNSSVVIGAARGIISHHNKSILAENGGHIELTTEWAKSLMKRMGLSTRRATKGVKSLPSDFDDLKNSFIKRFQDVVKEDSIPDEMIINWDQTGVNFVPCGKWTMAETGSKQVPLKGFDDKRQMTALLAISRSGAVLPPQLLYQGKTDTCHPRFPFPKEYDIYHSENHWSNTSTMIRYIDQIIIPYLQKIREENDYPLGQKGLCIFDVFTAHHSDEFLDYLARKRI